MMKITITIGDQRLTIVAQGDEYEIVLPERIERTCTTQNQASATPALRTTSRLERDSLTLPLPLENTTEAQQILSPEVLRISGVSLDMLQKAYDYVKKHDLCRFSQVCTALGDKRNSFRVKQALKILRVLGLVYKDSRERYSTRQILPSCSTEMCGKVYEIIEAFPGITHREIAQLLGHKASNGGVSDTILYLAGIKRIHAIPEVRKTKVIWRYHPAKQ